MLTSSETPIIAAVILVALGILAWGFYRSRPFGKLGILAWLQSVVLMAPWLVFFGLFAVGIYINIAGVLLLLVISTSIYILLGWQLRKAGQDVILKTKATERIASETSPAVSQTENGDSPVVIAQVKLEPITIPEEDLNTIKGIFGIDTFFATETIPYQEGAVFKGNLRGDA